jgi:hypothetical protein
VSDDSNTLPSGRRRIDVDGAANTVSPEPVMAKQHGRCT